MQDQQSRRIPVGAIAGVSALLLAVGGGTAWWVGNSGQVTPTAQVPSNSQPSSPKPLQASTEKTVQVYWLKNNGKHIEVVSSPITLKEANQPKAVLETAFEQLLAGPTNPKFTSTIPQGTKLLSLDVQNDNVLVNLSKEFTGGGGSASMTGRVAQVLYTATSLNPKAKVWIQVEGKQLDVLGGEGLELEQPVTRKYFEENFDL
jgi:spore germination protein GerM